MERCEELEEPAEWSVGSTPAAPAAWTDDSAEGRSPAAVTVLVKRTVGCGVKSHTLKRLTTRLQVFSSKQVEQSLVGHDTC